MRVRIEYQGDQWVVTSVGNQIVRVPFEQGVIKSSSFFYGVDNEDRETLGFEGVMQIMHGVDIAKVKFLKYEIVKAMGLVKFNQRGTCQGGIRLLSGGKWEYTDGNSEQGTAVFAASY